MELKYHDAAERAGVIVVSACGFDSIPADLGAAHNVASFPAGAVPACIESAFSVEAPKGLVGHFATYECTCRVARCCCLPATAANVLLLMSYGGGGG